MKTKYTMLVIAMGLSVAALAQENDDMYFNSKDRAIVVKANEVVLAKKYRQDDLDAVRSNPVNPSDSYSGRGVNPEYNAQAKSGTSVVQNDPDYFLSGYQPKNVNSNLYNNTSAYSNTYYNSGYGSSYGYSGFGSPYSSMYSPYAFGYSPYSMMSPYSMYSPYGSMYGMGMGSGFYSGFGMSYSMMYGSPYSMMGMGYGMGSMYYGMGGYGYAPYGYYPSTVVVTDSRSTAYGRHPSRSSGLNNYVNSNARNDASIIGSNGRVREGGRSRTDSQPNYYNSGWRNSGDFSNSRSGYSNGNSSWGSGSGNGWGGSGGNTRSSFDSFGSGTRGSFGGGHGGGGFSGGGGSSGGGGGGHSRGRN